MMRRTWIPSLMLAMLGAGPFVAAGQDVGTEEMEMRESAPMMPTAAKVAIWTDKLGYATGEQMSLYLTTNPMGDTNTYTEFIYLESIETGERKYITPKTGSVQMHEAVVDSAGMAAGAFKAVGIAKQDKVQIWIGAVPTPGLWQFATELRSPDTTQVVKMSYAKFVVSLNDSVLLGGDEMDTEISTDTTWTNDTIYRIQHQVFVNRGATLTIEAGTLILASGQNAVIVIQKGGKIMAEGRLDAPIVMTCDKPIGQRLSGCWVGMIVLGNAPTTRGTGLAEGVLPANRAFYGGNDPKDSSGVLQYVRVEFAGVEFAGVGINPESQSNAFGFYGVGSGTVIDHIQAHQVDGDGIGFFGGTADCTYCVSSGSKDDSLDWAFGWQGTAQHVFIQQDSSEGDNGIEADNDSSGFDRLPRSHPTLYNVTMIGGLAQDLLATSSDGMTIRVGTAITSRNLLVTRFGNDAIDVRDNSPSLFADGTSSIKNAILHANGYKKGDGQIESRGSGVEAFVAYMDIAPLLVNVRYEPNPDPRPMLNSPALKIGAGAVPPSDGKLDTSAQCIGAFCDYNWLEEWTFFGDEFEYTVP